ncbi:hypothetical protein SAMN04489712_109167 [Thermomonospora echinospora]|uniref:Uncharacterized protein n=1 Tax=Thermomonospora echinospora TaxID=1992 RepID=A0A1H6CBX0_9ACTN|nr:DUF6247 family protein [Thermomonospora echinospora]SEG70398.1 hypothetical protein SAMN04489712_109167 [Thermomonospora echinospora]
MSAQPVHYEDPQDPQVIMRDLPPRERELFLQQYQAAARAAAADPGRYQDLRRLLHTYSLIVVAANRPGYYESIQEAKSGVGDAVPLDEALAEELARRS